MTTFADLFKAATGHEPYPYQRRLTEALGYPLLTADEALLKRMKGHSIVLRLKDLEITGEK